MAYLLFRIADTIEDGNHLHATEKLVILDRFAQLLDADCQPAGTSLDIPRHPSDNSHYLALLHELPLVLTAVARLRVEVRDVVVAGVKRSLTGMKQFIMAGTDEGKVQLQTLSELRDYCYFVAGVVGEMLTEILVCGANWLSGVRQELDANARWFGEGLQLVNILKDSAEDERDGRIFIPRQASRDQLFDLAREDLHKAESYVRALKQAEAPRGFVAFTELPLQLAWRTLECVEAFGPGAKVPRREVMSIVAQTLSRSAPGQAPNHLGDAMA